MCRTSALQLVMTELFGRVTSARPPSADDATVVNTDTSGVRWLRRQLPGGVVAMTTVVDGLYRATTLTSVMVASVDPPQMLISVEAESQMERWLQDSGVFGLSFLGWKQQF